MMATLQDREKDVWKALEGIADPEIPVLSLTDLKIVRSVKVTDDGVDVEITPTFMGCPALERMKEDIKLRLTGANFGNIRIQVNLSTPWSTELLDESAKDKLRVFGIAPPPRIGESLAVTLELPVPCPNCSSGETRLESSFGSTLCKQIYYCNSCRQSFERFKPL